MLADETSRDELNTAIMGAATAARNLYDASNGSSVFQSFLIFLFCYYH